MNQSAADPRHNIARAQKINFLEIQKVIESEGGVFLPEYFSIDYVDEVLNSLSHVLNSGINNNMSGPVYFNEQIFVSQVLAHSEVVFNFMCDDLFELSKHILADPVVKAARYYETGPGGLSLWHHDEKNAGYSSRGLIAIIYLSDVLAIDDGPFEFIPFSHHVSEAMEDRDFFTDSIRERFGNNYTSCLGRRGSLIIADSKVVHRARPHNKRVMRKSLFTQISKIHEKQYKEQILVNPSFLNERRLNDRNLLTFLGFGLPCEKHIFPPTTIENLPLKKEVLKQMTLWLVKNLKRNCFEMLPKSAKRVIRKNLGREVDYGAQKR